VDFDVSAVLSISIPARPIRRKLSGAVCCVCHMRVHHLDAAVVELPFGQTKAIHQPCSALLWDAVIEANDNVAAHPELIEDDPADEA
jgi:hypothetical protein